MVLELARSLPTTLSICWFTFSPVTPVNNELMSHRDIESSRSRIRQECGSRGDDPLDLAEIDLVPIYSQEYLAGLHDDATDLPPGHGRAGAAGAIEYRLAHQSRALVQ